MNFLLQAFTSALIQKKGFVTMFLILDHRKQLSEKDTRQKEINTCKNLKRHGKTTCLIIYSRDHLHNGNRGDIFSQISTREITFVRR